MIELSPFPYLTDNRPLFAFYILYKAAIKIAVDLALAFIVGNAILDL